MLIQLLVPLLALLLSGCVAGQAAQGSPTARSTIAVPDTLDRYIEREMRERQIPGLALAIVRNGEIIRQQGYGVADVQNDVPATPDTRFELASITKQFTAAAVMMLVEEGKIDLDTSITRYLPDAPTDWEDVTVRHLMTHTSGLPPMGQGFSGSVGRIYGRLVISADDGYEAARADTLRAPPGERFAYSDVGYYLLGFITQHVSGTPWREFIRERIFEPLGMTNSFISDRFAVHRNLARGYTLRDGTLINLHRPWRFEVPSHGIGVFSTVGDLARWDAALYTDRPLSEASRREAWTPVQLNDGSTHPYGFGWQVEHPNGHLLLRHTGITGTEIVRLPDDTVTVIVLTNLGRGYGATVRSWGIARAIAEMVVPEIRRPENETALRSGGDAGLTPSPVPRSAALPPRSVPAGPFPSPATHSTSHLSGGE